MRIFTFSRKYIQNLATIHPAVSEITCLIKRQTDSRKRDFFFGTVGVMKRRENIKMAIRPMDWLDYYTYAREVKISIQFFPALSTTVDFYITETQINWFNTLIVNNPEVKNFRKKKIKTSKIYVFCSNSNIQHTNKQTIFYQDLLFN